MSISRAKIYAGGLTFVIPLGVMIYLLMAGVTPSYAASGAIDVLNRRLLDLMADWAGHWLAGYAI